MRALLILAFAVVLVSGAYAQQPGAYQQQPAYTQQPDQGGGRWTCSRLYAGCERSRGMRNSRAKAGVDCQTQFRSCMSTGTWVGNRRTFENVMRQ